MFLCLNAKNGKIYTHSYLGRNLKPGRWYARWRRRSGRLPSSLTFCTYIVSYRHRSVWNYVLCIINYIVEFEKRLIPSKLMHVWSAIVIRGPVKAQSTSYVVDTILWLRMKTFCLVIAHGWFVIWITCSFSLFLMYSNVHLTSWIVNFDCATTALKLRCCLYREHSTRLWASPSCLA